MSSCGSRPNVEFHSHELPAARQHMASSPQPSPPKEEREKTLGTRNVEGLDARKLTLRSQSDPLPKKRGQAVSVDGLGVLCSL